MNRRMRCAETGAERTARFNQWLKENPRADPKSLADALGKSVKTIYMWRLGRPRPIPAHTLEMLELRAERVRRRRAT